MSVLDRKWPRIVFAVVVALGLVAVTCVDVAVAQQRREHDRKVAAARALHRAETRYLNDVRAIAGKAYNVLQPYQQVLDAMYADPTMIYAARDAFAGPAPAKQVAALVARLDALSVPTTMRAHHAKLRAALNSYVGHLTSIRRQAHVTNYRSLYDAMDTDFGGEFSGDNISWQLALEETFAVHLDGPPKTPYFDASAPITLVTWVFRADRACDKTFDEAEPALRRFEKSTETPADFGLIGRLLQSFTTLMRRVPLPADQQAALRRDIVRRLPVVDASGRAMVAFTRGLEAHNSDAVRSAYQKILASGDAVKPLVAAFQSRHVVICRNLLADLVQIDEPTKHSATLST